MVAYRYASSSAGGSNDGTSWANCWALGSVPWSTLQSLAASQAVYLFLDGGTTSKTYTDKLTAAGSGSSDANRIFIMPGYAAQQMGVSGDHTGRTGQVIISATGDNAAIQLTGYSYITIDGYSDPRPHGGNLSKLKLLNASHDAGGVVEIKGSTCQYITVRRCEITKTSQTAPGDGVHVNRFSSAADRHLLIEENYFHDGGYWTGVIYYAAVWIDYVDNVVVRYNEIVDWGNGGSYRSGEGIGAYAGHQSGINAYGNLLINVGCGFRAIHIIRFNTIYSSYFSIQHNTAQSGTHYIENNLFYVYGDNSINTASSGLTLVVNNNTFYDDDSNCNAYILGTWYNTAADLNGAAWANANEAGAAGDLTSPPSDCTLSGGAVAQIDSADVTNFDPTRDFLNQSQSGTEWDIGAIEYDGGSSPPVGGTTYYFDSVNGSDSNTGLSREQAWQTRSKFNAEMVSTLVGDDTVVFVDGSSWTGPGSDGSFCMYMKCSGTSGHPITLTRSYDGAAPVFSNPASYGVLTQGIQLLGSYVTVDGLHITNCRYNGVMLEDSYTGRIIKNCEIDNCGQGILMDSASDRVHNNYVHDLVMVVNDAATDTDYGACGISLRNDSNEIDHNSFINCKAISTDYGTDGGAIEVWVGSGRTVNDCHIHHNYAENCDGFTELGGSGGPHVDNYVVDHNIMVNCGQVFYLHNGSGAGDPFPVTVVGMKWENNLCYDVYNWAPYMYACFSAWSAMTSTQISIRGNIFDVWRFDAVCESGKMGTAVHTYNQYYRRDGLAAFGFTPGATENEGNPLYVDRLNGDFHPTATSPTVDDGTDLGYTLDYDGNTIPIDGYDIGVYEYDSGSGTPTTLVMQAAEHLHVASTIALGQFNTLVVAAAEHLHTVTNIVLSTTGGGGGEEPPPAEPEEPTGELLLTLRDVRGLELAINGVYLLVDYAGLGPISVDHITESGAFQVGETFRAAVKKARIINLAIDIVATTRLEMWQKRGELTRFIANQEGGVWLVWTLPDGSLREILGRYTGTPDLGRDSKTAPTVQRCVFTIRCPEPGLLDPEAVVWTYAISAGAGAWGFPLGFPAGFGASTVEVAEVRYYPGSLPAYPVITIIGPAADVVIQNVSTGEKLDLTGYTINAGETVTIDCRYSHKTIYSSADGNIIANLSSDSDLGTFHIAPHPEVAGGDNSISVDLTGGTNATRVYMIFHKQHNGLYAEEA